MARALPDSPNPEIHDETRFPDGSARPGWAPILERLEALTPAQIQQRQQEVSRQLRANGIAYGGVGPLRVDERPWQLDLIPQIVAADDWDVLSAGLIQRARLKQALFNDIYGEQRVLSEGVLPPALVFAHAGYLRSAQDLPGTTSLPLYSADVSRSPSGKWYVVDDMCQSPNGIGYTLENRLVLARLFPNLFRDCNVNRVVGYFKALQQLLTATIDINDRCVLLAYGAAHAHYLEHAYLAKYLGFTLVETHDLTVRNQRVWLKTVAGLQRVDVILRFIDDQDTDPLAFSNGVEVGVPGLLQAAQSDHVKIINPLGASVLDNPALNAYLVPLYNYLLGEKPLLLSAPTYWMGDPEQLSHARDNIDDLLFRDVDTHGQLLDPTLMTAEQKSTLLTQLECVGWRYVAQERIFRSTAPSLIDDKASTRQITLRSFLVNTEQGFEAMTGGFCLLDSATGGRRPNNEALEGSKDVWVLSRSPVLSESLIPGREDAFEYAMLEGELPSRVADNLFWLGRQAERAENIVRVLRAVCQELQSEDVAIDSLRPSSALLALLRGATTITGAMPGFVGSGASRKLRNPDRELMSLLHDDKRTGTLASTLRQVHLTSSTIRDRVSSDLLRILNRLEDQQEEFHHLARTQHLHRDSDALNLTIDRLNALLLTLAAFAGLAHENFTHGDGWRFLMLGRRVERARQSAALIGSMMLPDSNDRHMLEVLLRVFDSVMTYRSRYRSRIDNRLVLHLLLLDESNPRSVAFQFQQIDQEIRMLPGMRRVTNQDPLLKIATAGLSRVRLADVQDLLDSDPARRQSLKKFLYVLENIPFDLASALTAAYFTHTDVPKSLATATLERKPGIDEERESET